MKHPEGKLNETGRIHVQLSPLLLKQLVVAIQQISQEQKQLNQYHHMDTVSYTHLTLPTRFAV